MILNQKFHFLHPKFNFPKNPQISGIPVKCDGVITKKITSAQKFLLFWTHFVPGYKRTKF